MNITLHPLFLRGLWLAVAVAVAVAVAGVLFCVQAEAAVPGQPGQKVTFNWEVIAGTCTVTPSLPSPVTFKVSDVTYPPLTNGMYKNWGAWVPEKTLTLALSCQGLGGSTQRPVVVITGSSMIPKDMGSHDKPEDQTLFSDAGAGTTSQGFGFYFKKNAMSGGSYTGHNEAGNGEQLYIPKGAGYYVIGDTLPQAVSIPLKVGVSCGYGDWCKPENLTAGKLTATVSFDFKYQ